jgi:hypothetical protein
MSGQLHAPVEGKVEYKDNKKDIRRPKNKGRQRIRTGIRRKDNEEE